MTGRNIYQRILAVMQETGAFSKDGKNAFHNYKYASIEAIVATIQPILVRHGLVLMYDVSTCEQIPIRQFTQGKGWVENEVTRVTVITTVVNADEPTEQVSRQTFGFGIDSQDKGVYKAISGARKYGIFGMFNLMAGDDDPESTGERKPRYSRVERPLSTHEQPPNGDSRIDHAIEQGRQAKAATGRTGHPTEKQVKMIYARVTAMGFDPKKFKAMLKNTYGEAHGDEWEGDPGGLTYEEGKYIIDVWLPAQEAKRAASGAAKGTSTNPADYDLSPDPTYGDQI